VPLLLVLLLPVPLLLVLLLLPVTLLLPVPLLLVPLLPVPLLLVLLLLLALVAQHADCECYWLFYEKVQLSFRY
jgi:hypothetical protein